MNTTRRYTSDWLRERRFQSSNVLPRRLRRHLFILGIFIRTSSHKRLSIPVRITPRIVDSTPSDDAPRTTCLTKIRRCSRKRLPRRKSAVSLPSLMLSNVRSLGNKLDEVELRVAELRPDLIVLTETWLDDTYDERAVSINSYHVVRKDRLSGRGGGIICYFRDIFSVSIISDDEVPSLHSAASEFLCLFFHDLFLVVVALYHPFWNDSTANHQAITLITDVADYASLTYGPEVRIIVCGDFNDLRHHFSSISLLTGLIPIVNFKTRDENTLDQVFVNFTFDKCPSFPPFACSDHCVIYWSPVSPKCSVT